MTTTNFRKLAGALAPGFLLLGASLPVPALAEAARLPDRVLTCRVGHATNLDALKQQDRDEITFDSYHLLSLRLPPIPARTTAPPDAIDAPEPVDPRTRILSDPDGLTTGTLGRFNRVIDLWPERVEMILPMDGGVSKLLIVSDFDAASSTAQLFVTTAADAATLDLKNSYLGPCSVRQDDKRKPS